MPLRWIPGTAATLAMLAAFGADAEVGRAAGASPGPSDSPGAHGIAFVGSETCGSCHPRAFEAWKGSHHDAAMQPATDQSVLGNFGDIRFTSHGASTRFFRRDGRYMVEAEGEDGKPAEFEVDYTFGVDPLQQYLVAFPGGRLQALSVAWDTQQKRWFDLHPDERIPADDALHWTGRYQTWNAMCAECHSTNLEKHYDAATDSYRTTWAGIDVGCEACHGPGERHVGWARDRSAEGAPASLPNRGLVAKLRGVSSTEEVDACARCHARRHRVSPEDRHGRAFLDDFAPELLREPLYHADGQIRDEVYAYGSFLQSRMYQRGVRCSDCHEPHAATLRADGNALCTRCHGASADPRFPTLRAGSYDAPEHHHHGEGSAGAACVACHMPERTYMVVDPRRDHSLRIPRPDLSETLGTPNACDSCHADRPSGWATAVVSSWTDDATPPAHFATAFDAARRGDPAAGQKLARVVRNREQPAIVRATAVALLRGTAPRGRDAVRDALRDPEPLVRASAAAVLDILPPEERVAAGAALLEDSVRAVRIDAARLLASVPHEQLTADRRRTRTKALAEYEAAQRAISDLPAGQLNLGALYMETGATKRALAAYEAALRMDPRFLPAAVNLANLRNRQGHNDEAERVLRSALGFAPEEGELHYSLGLVLAEERRIDEAERSLAEAVRLLPNRPRVRYNHALALQHTGRRDEAETELRLALSTAPNDPSIVHALAILYVQDGRFDAALPYAKHLAQLLPEERAVQQLLYQVQSALGGGAPR